MPVDGSSPGGTQVLSAEAQVGAALPLCAFLVGSGGQHGDVIVPELLGYLDSLRHSQSTNSQSTAERWKGLWLNLLEDLTAILKLSKLAVEHKKGISEAASRLLRVALEAMPGSVKEESDQEMLLGLKLAVVHFHEAGKRLPLLPGDAVKLLVRLSQSQFGVSNSGSNYVAVLETMRSMRCSRRAFV